MLPNNELDPQSKEQRQSAEAWNDFNRLFSEQRKLQILFILAGLKKGDDFNLQAMTDNLFEQDTREKEVKNIEQVLIELGLKLKTENSTIPQFPDVKNYTINFALDQQNLEELIALQHRHPRYSPEWEQAYGTFYGFPKTAIDAYPDNGLRGDELPDYIKQHPYRTLLPFVTSKDNVESEWKGFVTQVETAKIKQPQIISKLGLQNVLSTPVN